MSATANVIFFPRGPQRFSKALRDALCSLAYSRPTCEVTLALADDGDEGACIVENEGKGGVVIASAAGSAAVLDSPYDSAWRVAARTPEELREAITGFLDARAHQDEVDVVMTA